MSDTQNVTEYLTPADVGRVAGVTPGAVRALTARGRLPVAAVTASGVHLYTRQTAEQYAAERAKRRGGGGNDSGN